MKTIPLMAGLLAGLVGTAVLAQDAPPPPAPPPGPEAGPDAGPAAPGGPQGRPGHGPAHGPRGERGPGRDGPGEPGGPDDETYGMGPGFYLDIVTLDTDRDGRVTIEELQARTADRLTVADANGDGGLSPEELVAYEDALREEDRLARETARASERVATMDDNGDGLIQPAEMEARAPRLAPLFDRLDTDNDGGITQDEIDAERSMDEPMGPRRGRGDMGGAGMGPDGTPPPPPAGAENPATPPAPGGATPPAEAPPAP